MQPADFDPKPSRHVYVPPMQALLKPSFAPRKHDADSPVPEVEAEEGGPSPADVGAGYWSSPPAFETLLREAEAAEQPPQPIAIDEENPPLRPVFAPRKVQPVVDDPPIAPEPPSAAGGNAAGEPPQVPRQPMQQTQPAPPQRPTSPAHPSFASLMQEAQAAERPRQPVVLDDDAKPPPKPVFAPRKAAPAYIGPSATPSQAAVGEEEEEEEEDAGEAKPEQPRTTKGPSFASLFENERRGAVPKAAAPDFDPDPPAPKRPQFQPKKAAGPGHGKPDFGQLFVAKEVKTPPLRRRRPVPHHARAGSSVSWRKRRRRVPAAK
jgi:hypothetical protein